MAELTRRNFIKLLGAGVAEEILSAVKNPIIALAELAGSGENPNFFGPGISKIPEEYFESDTSFDPRENYWSFASERLSALPDFQAQVLKARFMKTTEELGTNFTEGYAIKAGTESFCNFIPDEVDERRDELPLGLKDVEAVSIYEAEITSPGGDQTGTYQHSLLVTPLPGEYQSQEIMATLVESTHTLITAGVPFSYTTYLINVPSKDRTYVFGATPRLSQETSIDNVKKVLELLDSQMDPQINPITNSDPLVDMTFGYGSHNKTNLPLIMEYIDDNVNENGTTLGTQARWITDPTTNSEYSNPISVPSRDGECAVSVVPYTMLNGLLNTGVLI